MDSEPFAKGFEMATGHRFVELAERLAAIGDTPKRRAKYRAIVAELRRNKDMRLRICEGDLSVEEVLRSYPRPVITARETKKKKKTKAIDADDCSRCGERACVAVELRRKPTMGHKFEDAYFSSCAKCGTSWEK